MAIGVSISGTHNQTISLQFDSSSNSNLATQLASFISHGLTNGTIQLMSDTSGSPTTVPAGVSGAYLQSTSSFVALPADYPIDIVSRPGPAVVLGSTANNQIVLSDLSTNLTFLASNGSGTVVAGGGDDRILTSGKAGQRWGIYTGNGNDRINALGSENATVSAGTGDNAIALGRGNDLVISEGNDSIAIAGGNVTVDATQAKSDFVQAGASHLLFLGGNGGATILGGSGSDTYFGSAGPAGKQLIQGGSGGNNLLMAGDGAATLTGGGNNDMLYAYGSKAQLLRAAGGNETLSAALSSGHDTLVGGSGQDQLIGGSGNDTFIAGSGNATVTAGSANALFEFVNRQAGGTELVMGLTDPTAVHIDLHGYGSNAIDMALLSQTVTDGAVSISLTDGTRITFDDISHLDRSNFTSH